MDRWSYAGITAAILLIIGIVTVYNSVTMIDQHQAGYEFDVLTGDINIIPRKGWYFHRPFVVRVHTIELRPAQVCIKSMSSNVAVNNRVLNCKLVRFNPDKKALIEFINMHGRDSYDHAELMEILKIYAYDQTRPYSFLIVEADMTGTGERQRSEEDVLNDNDPVGPVLPTEG